MNRLAPILATVLFATPALAEDPYQGEGDNSFGPYETNASLTTGALSGFTSLHAPAESLQSGLKPGVALSKSGTQLLTIENTSLSSVTVTVGGTKVGTLGPVTIGRIQGIAAGEYTVVLGHPNGYNQTLSLTTTSVVDGAPAASPDAAETTGNEVGEEQADGSENQAESAE